MLAAAAVASRASGFFRAVLKAWVSPRVAGTIGSVRWTPSVRVTWDQIVAASPEVIVFMPCGYDLEAAAAEATSLLGRPELLTGDEWADPRFRLQNSDVVRLVAQSASAGRRRPVRQRRSRQPSAPRRGHAVPRRLGLTRPPHR